MTIIPERIVDIDSDVNIVVNLLTEHNTEGLWTKVSSVVKALSITAPIPDYLNGLTEDIRATILVLAFFRKYLTNIEVVWIDIEKKAKKAIAKKCPNLDIEGAISNVQNVLARNS